MRGADALAELRALQEDVELPVSAVVTKLYPATHLAPTVPPLPAPPPPPTPLAPPPPPPPTPSALAPGLSGEGSASSSVSSVAPADTASSMVDGPVVSLAVAQEAAEGAGS
ncbi:unnamed protein product, partial [Laminaria digitata]